jgi:molecular chaperone DnaK
VPQIEVTFDIDANGILHVTAKDRATGAEQNITITGSGQLADNEVQNMVEQAKQHAEEDEKFKELAEARNQGDQLAYQLEKSLNELGDKVDGMQADSIREKIKDLREKVKSDDAAVIRAAMEALQQEFSAVSQAIYEQAGATEGQPGPGAAEPGAGAEGPTEAESGGPEVIDAEFEAQDEEE